LLRASQFPAEIRSVIEAGNQIPFNGRNINVGRRAPFDDNVQDAVVAIMFKRQLWFVGMKLQAVSNQLQLLAARGIVSSRRDGSGSRAPD
jgi:hypothetical protein